MDDRIIELQDEVSMLRLANKRLQSEVYQLQQYVYALQFVSETSKDQPSEDSQDHLRWWLNHTMEQTLEMFSSPEGSLLVLDNDSNQLEFALVHGTQTNLVGKRLNVGEGIAGWVAENAEACLVPNVQDDERFSKRIDELQGFETRSIIAAPIIGRGKVLGVMEILNQEGEKPFTDLDRARLSVFCDLVGEALARIKIVVK